MACDSCLQTRSIWAAETSPFLCRHQRVVLTLTKQSAGVISSDSSCCPKNFRYAAYGSTTRANRLYRGTSWLPGNATMCGAPRLSQKALARLNSSGAARWVMSPDTTSTSGFLSFDSALSACTTSGSSVPKCRSEICNSFVMPLQPGRPLRASSAAAAYRPPETPGVASSR